MPESINFESRQPGENESAHASLEGEDDPDSDHEVADNADELPPSFQVFAEFEGKTITTDVNILDCLWNSAEISNIVNGILLTADVPSFQERGAEQSPVFKALCEADPRLTLIAEYWSLYNEGLRQNTPEEKELTAHRMEEIRKELGVHNYPSTYFDPIKRMQEFYPKARES